MSTNAIGPNTIGPKITNVQPSLHSLMYSSNGSTKINNSSRDKILNPLERTIVLMAHNGNKIHSHRYVKKRKS